MISSESVCYTNRKADAEATFLANSGTHLFSGHTQCDSNANYKLNKDACYGYEAEYECEIRGHRRRALDSLTCQSEAIYGSETATAKFDWDDYSRTGHTTTIFMIVILVLLSVIQMLESAQDPPD